MVMTSDKMGMEITEPERVLEEFRQKLIHSLAKEKEKMREVVNKDAKIILSKAYQESAALTTRAQDEARDILTQAKEQANRGLEEALAKAQQRSQEIITDAEENIRRDAKERSRKEVEAIIRTAKEESVKQNTRILQTAREEANKVLSTAKKEADTLLASANESRQKAQAELASAQKKTQEAVEEALLHARQEAAVQAEKQAEEIISQAKLRAQKEREFVLASTLKEAKEASEAEAAEIRQRAEEEAEDIIMAAQEKVKLQLDESTRLMMDIQQRMSSVMGASMEMKSRENRVAQQARPAPAATPASETKQEHAPEKTENHEQGNKPNQLVYDEANQTYNGHLKIDIAPPTDNEQITTLEKLLLKTPSLRITSRGGAEDGSAWIELDIAEPTQLVDILKKIPSVKDVVGAKSYVILALKAKQTG